MAPAKTQPDTSYTSKDVRALDDREAVRLRPGMYIGSTDSQGIAHVIAEAIDNAVDEALQGFCSDVWVEIKRDSTVTVRDNGRGMPLGTSTTADGRTMPTPQMLTTVLHAGGKFGQGSYDASGGLHGVGAKTMAFLSTLFAVDIWRDGQHYHQEMRDGAARIDAPVIKPHKGTERGTQLTFRYDPECFDDDAHVDAERIVAKLRAASYPVKGLSLHFKDDRTGDCETFRAERDLEDLMDHLVGEAKPLMKKPIRLGGKVEIEKGDPRNWVKTNASSLTLDVVIMPTDDTQPGDRSMSYTNVIPNPDGGDHLSGARTGLARAVKRWMTKNNATKSADTLDSSDILQGLVLVVSVRMNDPKFASQHKTRLSVGPVNALIAGMVDEGMTEWLDSHKKEADAWAKEVEAAREARLDFVKTRKAQRERSGQTIDTLLTKLAREERGCKPEDAELFIVEGDSAGGSAKEARDRATQAILPLFGKPENPWRAKVSKIVAHKGLATIAAAIGQEYRAPWDISSLKYHKVVLLADADADGLHIQALYIALAFQEFRPLIEGGHLFVARTPLFSVASKTGKDKSKRYFYDERSKDRYIAGRPDDFIVQRFKGLGEMNAKDLKRFAFDPATRTLQRVTIGDAQMAHDALEGLIGPGSVNARYRHDYLRRMGTRDMADLLSMTD